MMHSLFLALALTGHGQHPTELTEQQLTKYVNEKVKYEQQYGLPELFDASVKLDRMAVELGRQQADMARVTSQGRFTLRMPGKPPIDGSLTANFQAKPRYAPAEGAIYFDQFSLLDYQLTPESLNQQFAPLVSYLVQGLQQRLASQPAYRLDDRDPDQAWLKAHVTGFVIQPGTLQLVTRP